MNYYCGVDIGGSKIKAVLLKGLSRQNTELFAIDTSRNKHEFLRKLEDLIFKVSGKKPVAGIGIGVPGMIDAGRGILIKATNLPFLDNWKVKDFFSRFASGVRIDNDSRCFLRGEASWGAARGYKNVVGVALGTGIGGGIMIDGKIYYGKNNSAGEVGHHIMQIKSLKSVLGEVGESKIKSFENLASRKAFERGNQSWVVGIGIANLINILDPDAVVLGGGGMTSKKVRLDTVRHFAKKYIVSPRAKNTPIVVGKLGDAAQAIGAALLVKSIH
jgi:predicted NBD/HSP70 family sugar kinase